MTNPNAAAPWVGEQTVGNAAVLMGLSRFSYMAGEAPLVPPDDHEPLFSAIRDDPTSEAAAASVQRLGEAYSRLAISIARNEARRNSDMPLDDLVGAACVGLMEGIRSYATLDEYRGCGTYLRTTIKNKVSEEIFLQRHGITDSNDRAALVAYFRARNSLPPDAPRRDIAQAMDAPEAEVLQLESMLGWIPTANADAVPARGILQEEGPTTRRKRILLERALSLLPKERVAHVLAYYGLGDTVQCNSVEEAAARSMSAQSVRTATYLARGVLHTILPQLAEGTFDFFEWRRTHPKCKSPFMLAGLLGLAIGPFATADEISQQVLETLRATEPPELVEQLDLLYGLSGEPLSGKEIGRRGTYASYTVSRNERLFADRLEAAHTKDMAAPETPEAN